MCGAVVNVDREAVQPKRFAAVRGMSAATRNVTDFAGIGRDIVDPWTVR